MKVQLVSSRSLTASSTSNALNHRAAQFAATVHADLGDSVLDCPICHFQIHSRKCSAYSSALGLRLLLIITLAQEFHRSIASSFPAGRIASAFSNHSIAS